MFLLLPITVIKHKAIYSFQGRFQQSKPLSSCRCTKQLLSCGPSLCIQSRPDHDFVRNNLELSSQMLKMNEFE